MGKINKDRLKEKQGKLDFTLLPPEALEEVARVLQYGALKHGRFSWRGYPLATYIQAAERHLNALKRGNWEDEETGLPHMAHIACSCLFLIELEKHSPEQWEEWKKENCWNTKSPPTSGDVPEGGQK